MDIGLNKRPTVVSWYDLKACMRAWFVPPPYRKEHLLKLQWLHQRPWIVDEYFHDLETTLTKINMHDNEESKIARFVRSTSNFQKGQSSQNIKLGPTKPQDNIITRRSHKAKHLKFFLLVFLNN